MKWQTETYRTVTFAALVCAVFALSAEPDGAMLPAPLRTVEYNLRLRPSANREARVCVFWNFRDSTDYNCVTCRIPPLAASATATGFDCRYEVHSVCAGTDSILDSGAFAASYSDGAEIGFSAILRADAVSAGVSFGTDRISYTVPVPFDMYASGLIGYTSTVKLRELRNDVYYTSVPAPEYAPFSDTDALMRYLEASTDGVEGLWNYLDRDTDPSLAMPAARYRMATVAEDSGSYAIVLLDSVGNFNPLQIKGRLTPTPFQGHYNLYWLDASGLGVDAENSATLEVQGTVLRLSFPLLKSTLRYMRVK
ncbi:MAG: hypothetical protein K2J38_01410 [Muribaculaceae bacterium]|nr:hypothetical protein [Muribaculaceae bacterium]